MDDPHTEVKPQLKPRGNVTKEEDPKPSQQVYKLQIKSTRSIGRLCICGIYKRPLRVPTKEIAVVLMAVNSGGKNAEQ